MNALARLIASAFRKVRRIRGLVDERCLRGTIRCVDVHPVWDAARRTSCAPAGTAGQCAMTNGNCRIEEDLVGYPAKHELEHAASCIGSRHEKVELPAQRRRPAIAPPSERRCNGTTRFFARRPCHARYVTASLPEGLNAAADPAVMMTTCSARRKNVIAAAVARVPQSSRSKRSPQPCRTPFTSLPARSGQVVLCPAARPPPPIWIRRGRRWFCDD